jgi:hypothetical protein
MYVNTYNSSTPSIYRLLVNIVIIIYRLFDAVTFQKEGQGDGTMSLSEYENFLIAYDILGVKVLMYVFICSYICISV